MRRRPDLLSPEPVPPLGEALEFLRLVWAVHHRIERVSKRMLRALGVSSPQRLVLRIVGRFPGITAGGLAEILHVHPSTLTGVLRRLERRDLIERGPDPRDGRRACLVLTNGGRRLGGHADGTVEAAVERALGRLTASQVRSTRYALRTLASMLDGPMG